MEIAILVYGQVQFRRFVHPTVSYAVVSMREESYTGQHVALCPLHHLLDWRVQRVITAVGRTPSVHTTNSVSRSESVHTQVERRRTVEAKNRDEFVQFTLAPLPAVYVIIPPNHRINVQTEVGNMR